VFYGASCEAGLSFRLAALNVGGQGSLKNGEGGGAFCVVNIEKRSAASVEGLRGSSCRGCTGVMEAPAILGAEGAATGAESALSEVIDFAHVQADFSFSQA